MAATYTPEEAQKELDKQFQIPLFFGSFQPIAAIVEQLERNVQQNMQALHPAQERFQGCQANLENARANLEEASAALEKQKQDRDRKYKALTLEINAAATRMMVLRNQVAIAERAMSERTEERGFINAQIHDAQQELDVAAKVLDPSQPRVLTAVPSAFEALRRGHRIYTREDLSEVGRSLCEEMGGKSGATSAILARIQHADDNGIFESDDFLETLKSSGWNGHSKVEWVDKFPNGRPMYYDGMPYNKALEILGDIMGLAKRVSSPSDLKRKRSDDDVNEDPSAISAKKQRKLLEDLQSGKISAEQIAQVLDIASLGNKST